MKFKLITKPEFSNFLKLNGSKLSKWFKVWLKFEVLSCLIESSSFFLKGNQNSQTWYKSFCWRRIMSVVYLNNVIPIRGTLKNIEYSKYIEK